MNIIYKLFNEQFVKDLFKKKILPKYPDFIDIKKIKIQPHKKNIWETTYHVVIEFKTYFITKSGKTKILPIFCSAHSNEPRKNVYHVLKFLWNNSFANGFLTIPHPLFYSNYFKATFYRGAQGNNLYYYIRNKNYEVIETLIPKTAAWFAKLHKLPTNNACNFNKQNSRIKTVVPGKEHILADIQKQYPHYYQTYKTIYETLITMENKFMSSTSNRWIIHGDAHPENIIKMGKKKIAVIDFTDMCLSDFARDLGCFMQQLEYMCMRKINNARYVQKIKNLFLETYLKNAKIKLDSSLSERIHNYYNWTAIRTATFFLIKHNPEPDRAKLLIKQLAINN